MKRFLLSAAVVCLLGGSVALAGLIAQPVHDFGYVPQGLTETRFVTVFNAGLEDLTNVVVEKRGAPFWFDVGTCGDTISKNDSCELEISFTPTRPGRFVGHVILSGEDSQGEVSLAIRLEGESDNSN